ncbi:hypothetical protein [Methylomicrobium album]|uniref:hypothetical protein n=1 Tax=Methylomicrobium album TaxID=39775 RepID=UPI001BC871D9|nr:hypothetical protein [Methylomicrobium album]
MRSPIRFLPFWAQAPRRGGIVAGFGELVGYLLRLVSGYLADRTRLYWPITMIGYAD